MKQKAVLATLMLWMCIVLVLPSFTAEAVIMEDDFKDKIADDTSGMLFNGINVIGVDPSDEEYTIVSFPIYYFNTYDEDVTYHLKVHKYHTEREHTVKEDYTYYFLPDLNWVSLSEAKCVIPPDHYYEVEVTVRMPTEEAFELAGDGGFIFTIDGETSGGNLNLVPMRKVFLTLNHEGYVPGGEPVVVPWEVIGIIMGSIVAIGIIYIILIKKKAASEKPVQDEFSQEGFW